MKDVSKLPSTYVPKQHEAAMYRAWEEAEAFKPFDEAQGKRFVIALPPPNITGSLHMGHALQDTIMDILSRYHRMKGEPVLWLPGTDHAAIATNKIIEEQLHTEGKTRWDIGREEFQKRTEEWYEKTGAQIITQMKRLGCSCDWSRIRFTMDDKYYHAVQEAFVRYYEKGYIYRGARIVNWDPKSQTTVSDLEIEWKEETAPFYTFTYGPFEIGTARPETKFGDKYVVMHPGDARYSQYKHGDTFEAEWINGSVTATVIKDEAADPLFGSGVMTITPWHDATDFEIAQRHSLDMEQIIDFDGKLLPIAGEFAGMDIETARPKIVEKLREKGLLVSIDEKYRHNVAVNDRGKGTIEPQVMRQWFVDMSKLKDSAIRAAREDAVRFVPPRWKKHFIEWMENVHDWNINRQIWLGHRLPVWWKKGTHGTQNEEGNFVVALESLGEGYEQDPDVLDTWFSSALWPFAALGWPFDKAQGKSSDLDLYFPTSVLVTARDILYLWVARMIFSSLEFLGKVPFRDVLIHPVVLAKDGRRMSKSLGTGVDPLELIEEYGADATRFGLMHQMSFDSQAMKFDTESIKSGRNFANKLWNIARLLDSLDVRGERSVADDWIEARVQKTDAEVSALLDQYKIGEASRVLYDFVWKDFADWYVEIVKHEGSTEVANHVFERVLVLLHPFMPHITEALWNHIGHKKLLIFGPWAHGESAEHVTESVSTMRYFQDVVSAIRSARSLFGVSPASPMSVYSEKEVPLLEALSFMARANSVSRMEDGMQRLPLAHGGWIAVGADGIVAESVEKARTLLAKQQQELEHLITSQERTLSQMQGKAPEEKIMHKQESVLELRQKLEEIRRSGEMLSF